LPADSTLDAKDRFPAIKMPNRNKFVGDTRPDVKKPGMHDALWRNVGILYPYGLEIERSYKLIALARTEWSANSFLDFAQCLGAFLQANIARRSIGEG